MTLRLLKIPSQDGYSVELPNAARHVQRRGAIPRTRLDILDPAHRVQVAWRLNRSEYDAFMAFYDRVTYSGEQFEIDLIVGDFTLRPYLCEFVPASLQAGAFEAAHCVVQAQVEAQPLTDVFTAEADNSLMDLFEEYGEEAGDLLAELEALVNWSLPG